MVHEPSDAVGRVLDSKGEFEDADEVQYVIRSGRWLKGTGLIGEILDCACAISEAAVEEAYYEKSEYHDEAARKLGDAWEELYQVLKRLEAVFDA